MFALPSKKEQSGERYNMTDKELRKLSRGDLMQILLEQSKEIQALRDELAKKEAALEDKRILIENSGSIAEAALKLNGIFEAAEAACKQYTDNLRELNSRKEENVRTETNEKAKNKEKSADSNSKADGKNKNSGKKAKKSAGSKKSKKN